MKNIENKIQELKIEAAELNDQGIKLEQQIQILQQERVQNQARRIEVNAQIKILNEISDSKKTSNLKEIKGGKDDN